MGFAYCHLVLDLDSTHLKGRYNGVLLAATFVDINGHLFLLTYAVVDAENDDNWAWFVKSLHTSFSSMFKMSCTFKANLCFRQVEGTSQSG